LSVHRSLEITDFFKKDDTFEKTISFHKYSIAIGFLNVVIGVKKESIL